MKVMIASDILLDIVMEGEYCNESLQLLNTIDYNKISSYISIMSAVEICKTTSQEINIKIIRILENLFEIIDLRLFDLKKSIDSDNLIKGIVISQAKRYKIDYIITRDIEKYRNHKVRIVSPKQFGQLLKDGKAIK